MDASHACRGAIIKRREVHYRMTGKRVWFVTGAGRGMGVDIANAALAAGHMAVATGRNTKAVETAEGKAHHLELRQRSATRLAEPKTAAAAAVPRVVPAAARVRNA